LSPSPTGLIILKSQRALLRPRDAIAAGLRPKLPMRVGVLSMKRGKFMQILARLRLVKAPPPVPAMRRASVITHTAYAVQPSPDCCETCGRWDCKCLMYDGAGELKVQ